MKNINKVFRFFIFVPIVLSVTMIVLSFSGCNSEPAITYDYQQGFKILFSSEINDQYDLYSLDIDNNKLAQLTNTKVSDYQASFSPDGSKIIFVSFGEKDADEELFVMSPDGTNLSKITDNEFNEDDPIFNADGTKIIYVSDRYQTDINNPYPVSGIYKAGLDGSDEEIFISQDRTYNGYDPCLSPDGKFLLYCSYWSYDDEIYLLEIEGDATVVNLTNKSGWDGRPAFSPDGSKIAFASSRDSSGENTEIYIMDSSGKNVSRLTNSNSHNTDPCFSPDSKFIVFSSNSDGDYDIYMMDTNGKGLINLTNNSNDDYYPCFFPG